MGVETSANSVVTSCQYGYWNNTEKSSCEVAQYVRTSCVAHRPCIPGNFLGRPCFCHALELVKAVLSFIGIRLVMLDDSHNICKISNNDESGRRRRNLHP